MKSIAYVWIAGVLVAGLMTGSSAAQSDSLGDYARAARKEKKAPTGKRFDNENLPQSNKLSIVGNAPAEPAEAEKTKTAEGEEAKKAEGDENKKPSESEGQQGETAQKPKIAQASTKTEEKDEAAERNKEWQEKIAAQKNQIELIGRELDVLQREFRLRSAAFYADAGNRLRSQAEWDKEDADYSKQIAQKQKALDEAKQQLEDLQEQARKAGVPSGSRE